MLCSAFPDADVYESVREFWNARDSEDFDSKTRRSGRMEAIDLVAALAKPHVSREGVLTIDLGCGTGLFAESVGVKRVIGVDFSSPFLTAARRRMDTVWQRNIFDLRLAESSVDNVVSLFVIDDYPSEKKRVFFTRIFSYLKADGCFFFAAYSPNDERMGSMREVINARTGVSFEIHLEDASSYESMLRQCGFTIDRSEILRTNGLYEEIALKREFVVIVARKPRVMPCREP